MAFGGLLPPLSDRSQSETHFTPQPCGLEGYCRQGPGGLAGGCQTCGTHISVTAWRIFSIRSFVELSRPLVVHCHGHLPICPIWACPWAKNLSNLPQIGSRLCGQMALMLHNYRLRQFHRTSNGINPSSGFKDIGSAKSDPSAAWFDKFLAHGQTHIGQMGK